MTNQTPTRPRSLLLPLAVVACTALATFVVLALLVNIFTRKQEARSPFVRVVEVTEDTIDPSVWGQNWPQQYDSFMRTVDSERTRYGGSEAIPKQKLDEHPWLRKMFSGYAFSLDYREARGHAYMLLDQDHTERVHQRSQPGACLHCHSSVLPIYRHVGEGDIQRGFELVNAMRWNEARHMQDAYGNALVSHPVSCVDCHDPGTMALRVTRPAFKEGIRRYMASQGVENYDVNRDATRQQMRTFSCAQCHVEYYFAGPDTQLVYPWHYGLKVEEIERYYDDIGFTDWKHGITGAPVLKAQHPEFELYSQGIHARSGVSCADCHMPYERVGAMKISNHHVRSPLLNVAASCQTCHRVPERELLDRAHRIQDTTVALIGRASEALVEMMDAIVQARAAGASEADLATALDFHRKAQWRLDFVYSENSHGSHAPQAAARIRAEAIDDARLGVASALALRTSASDFDPADIPEPAPVEGVTPTEKAPPLPTDR